MCAPDPPAPPDPKETGAAQTGTNIGTAIANNTMRMVDQYTPTGSLTYEQTGEYTYDDPFTEQSYTLPKYSSTVELSPEQQAIQDASDAAKGNLAELAAERSDFLRGYLPTTESATDSIDAKLYDLGAKRLDPRYEREEDALRTRLANQGIVQGSEAFEREMESLRQSKNDAYNQLLLRGRGTAMSEVNAPINQITALLSGSQVSSPQVQPITPTGAATTDVAGLIGDEYDAKLNAYNAKLASRNSILGGLFGLGAKAIAGGMF